MAMTDPAQNHPVVALEGEIDMHESPQVREQFEPLIARRAGKVVVDLTGVSYIDSSGLAVLIDAMQRIQAYGGKLALQKIFEIARLDKVFSIFVDRAAALQG
jgi:anti-sigma B factor antagonist